MDNKEDNNIMRVCHDVKNPIGIINGLVNLCRINIDNKEYLCNYFNKIELCCSNILGLVNDCLDNSMLFNEKYFYIDRFIVGVKEDMEVIYKNNINIELNVCHKYIYADYFKLLEIINNILSNSCKYSFSDNINIIINEEQIDDNTSYYFFIIEDFGVGINEVTLKDLFIPYKRGVDNIDGHGLGMSIVKNLVDNMNGEIFVCSSLGCGTKFSVKLPFRFK